MKTKLTSFALLIFVCVCTHVRADKHEKWAVGRWLLISITNAVPTSQDAPTEMEKQMMIFQEDGSIRHYSKEKGFKDLVFEYKTIDNEMYLQGPKNKFLPAGQLSEDGKLVMDFRKGRIMVYQRISPLTSFDEIDFDGVIKIQFKPNKSANQNIEPTVKTPVE
jgi:hypothetical protein